MPFPLKSFSQASYMRLRHAVHSIQIISCMKQEIAYSTSQDDFNRGKLLFTVQNVPGNFRKSINS